MTGFWTGLLSQIHIKNGFSASGGIWPLLQKLVYLIPSVRFLTRALSFMISTSIALGPLPLLASDSSSDVPSRAAQQTAVSVKYSVRGQPSIPSRGLASVGVTEPSSGSAFRDSSAARGSASVLRSGPSIRTPASSAQAHLRTPQNNSKSPGQRPVTAQNNITAARTALGVVAKTAAPKAKALAPAGARRVKTPYRLNRSGGSVIVSTPKHREILVDSNKDGRVDDWYLFSGPMTYHGYGFYQGAKPAFVDAELMRGNYKFTYKYMRHPATSKYRLVSARVKQAKAIAKSVLIVGCPSEEKDLAALSNQLEALIEPFKFNPFGSAEKNALRYINKNISKYLSGNSGCEQDPAKLAAVKAGMALVLASGAKGKGNRFLGCLRDLDLGGHADRIQASLNVENGFGTSDSTSHRNRIQVRCMKGGPPGLHGSFDSRGGLISFYDSVKSAPAKAVNAEADISNETSIYDAANVSVAPAEGSLAKADAESFGETLFHELVHSSGIDDEPTTHALEECCSLNASLRGSNAACNQVKKTIAERKASQGLEYACTKSVKDCPAVFNDTEMLLGTANAERFRNDYFADMARAQVAADQSCRKANPKVDWLKEAVEQICPEALARESLQVFDDYFTKPDGTNPSISQAKCYDYVRKDTKANEGAGYEACHQLSEMMDGIFLAKLIRLRTEKEKAGLSTDQIDELIARWKKLDLEENKDSSYQEARTGVEVCPTTDYQVRNVNSTSPIEVTARLLLGGSRAGAKTASVQDGKICAWVDKLKSDGQANPDGSFSSPKEPSSDQKAIDQANEIEKGRKGSGDSKKTTEQDQAAIDQAIKFGPYGPTPEQVRQDKERAQAEELQSSLGRTPFQYPTKAPDIFPPGDFSYSNPGHSGNGGGYRRDPAAEVGDGALSLGRPPPVDVPYSNDDQLRAVESAVGTSIARNDSIGSGFGRLAEGLAGQVLPTANAELYPANDTNERALQNQLDQNRFNSGPSAGVINDPFYRDPYAQQNVAHDNSLVGSERHGAEGASDKNSNQSYQNSRQLTGESNYGSDLSAGERDSSQGDSDKNAGNISYKANAGQDSQGEDFSGPAAGQSGGASGGLSLGQAPSSGSAPGDNSGAGGDGSRASGRSSGGTASPRSSRPAAGRISRGAAANGGAGQSLNEAEFIPSDDSPDDNSGSGSGGIGSAAGAGFARGGGLSGRPKGLASGVQLAQANAGNARTPAALQNALSVFSINSAEDQLPPDPIRMSRSIVQIPYRSLKALLDRPHVVRRLLKNKIMIIDDEGVGRGSPRPVITLEYDKATQRLVKK
jgi:hypothetical protein